MNDTPSSRTPSFAPLSMRIVIAAWQSPSVGWAARLEVMHGHKKVQLQVSMYSPLICQPAIRRSSELPGAPQLGRDGNVRRLRPERKPGHLARSRVTGSAPGEPGLTARAERPMVDREDAQAGWHR